MSAAGGLRLLGSGINVAVMLSQKRHIQEEHLPHIPARWLVRPIPPLLLFGLILLLAIVGLLTSDTRELVRRLAVMHLRNALQRNVELDALTIDPHGRIVAEKLVIYDSLHSRQIFVSAKQVDIRFNPGSLFVLPFRPLSHITSITVDAPYARLTRDSAGRWNFNDLIKPRKKPSKDVFRGELIVKHGDVLYDDARGFGPRVPPLREHLTDLSLRVLAAEKGYLPFRLTANADGGKVKKLALAGGLNLTSRNVRARVKYTDADLAFVRRFLPPTLPLVITAGRADGYWLVSAAMAPKTGRLLLNTSVNAQLREVQGTATFAGQSVPFVVARGQLHMVDGALELTDVVGIAGGVPLTAAGSLTNFAHPVYRLQLEARDTDAARLAQRIPGVSTLPLTWENHATARATITGSGTQVRVTGRVQGVTVHSAEFGTYREVSGDIHLDGDLLELTNLTANGLGGRLAGTAWITLPQGETAGPAMLFKGEADQVELAQVLATFVPRQPGEDAGYSLHALSGPVSGPVAMTVDPDQRVTIITEAGGEVAYGTLTHGKAQASLRITAHNGMAQIAIERAQADTPQGRFQAHGTISETAALDIVVHGSKLDLAEMGKVARRDDLTGTGYVSGRLTGTPDALAFAGTLHAQQGRVAGRAFDDLHGDVLAATGPKPRLELQNGHVIAGNTRLDLTASALNASADSTVPAWQLTGKAEISATTVEALEKALDIDLPLEGFVERGSLVLSGLPEQPAGQGVLTLRRPKMLLGKTPLKLDSATVEFSISGQTVQIDSGLLVYHGIPLTVTGSLSRDPNVPPARQLSLQVEAPSIDLDNLTALVQEIAPGEGLLTADGRVRLPLDVEGKLALRVSISAGLFAEGKGIADTLAHTVVAQASISAVDGITVAAVPFARVALEGTYTGAERRIDVRTCDLQRADEAGGYRLALVQPGGINLTDGEIDLQLQFAGVEEKASADLGRVRRDLITMSTTGGAGSLLLPAWRTIARIPAPFAGRADIGLALSGTMRRPVLSTDFAFTSIKVGGNAMPNITGSLTYDTAPRLLTIANFAVSGGPDEDATAEMTGTITLPRRDAEGREIEPGPINVEFNSQQISVGWINTLLQGSESLPAVAVGALEKLGGEITIFGEVVGTTANPTMQASIDVAKPVLSGIAFNALTASVLLDNQGLWIGRWTNAAAGVNGTVLPGRERALGWDADDNTLTVMTQGTAPTRIVRRAIQAGSGAKLVFKGDEVAPEPLEIFGYIPFRWQGSLQPEIPVDEQLLIAMRLPEQGLELVRTYVPKMPRGKGSVAGMLEVRGTLDKANPLQLNGDFRAQAPELILKNAGEDMPDRLRAVSVDLAFHSDGAVGAANVIEIKDLSAIYGYAARPAAKKATGFARLLKGLLGQREKKVPVQDQGVIVAQGTIRIDIEKLLDAQQALVPLEEIPNRLQYDVYAKTVRAPVSWASVFQGQVSSYLHLVHRPGEMPRPLLTGVVYAEDLLVTFTGQTFAQSSHNFFVPVDPDLSIALQMGARNRFEIEPNNPLFRNSFSATIPFLPSPMVSPISVADYAWLQQVSSGGAGPSLSKPPIVRSHPAFRYTAATARVNRETGDPFAGTYGWVTGRLSAPLVQAHLEVEPRKSRVLFPRGVLQVEKAVSELVVDVGKMRRGEEHAVRLLTKAEATGMVDNYKIQASIDSDLLQNRNGRLPINLSMVSAPPGAVPIEEEEIYSRLIGFRDIVGLLGKDQQAWSSFSSSIGPNLLLREWLDRVAQKVGLESIALNFNQTWEAEASVTTPEYFSSKWSAFRLGSTYTFTKQPEWKLWLDYRMPEHPVLKDFSISADTDQDHGVNLNLLYRREF